MKPKKPRKRTPKKLTPRQRGIRAVAHAIAAGIVDHKHRFVDSMRGPKTAIRECANGCGARVIELSDDYGVPNAIVWDLLNLAPTLGQMEPGDKLQLVKAG